MKYNFGAGPCMLAKEVFEEASQAVINFNNTGLSILEISHRSKEFEEVVAETEALVRKLLKVPSTHEILFLQGGASTQFALVPLNLLPVDGMAAYLDTGIWANKAIQEARIIGRVEIVDSSSFSAYNFIPKDYTIPSAASYFHYTSNNTICGTEMFDPPQAGVPLVCDMSSDIFSRSINVADFGLIYAGAQKNTGPAGMTLVIIQKDLLGKTKRALPAIFDYQTHIASKSMYNTPAVYAMYVAMLNLRWLVKKGGIQAIEQANIIKAQTLYNEIDNNPLFKGTACVEDRSRMNITFTAKSVELGKEFADFARKRGVVGIEGHRLVGGFRASLYNALDLSMVNALTDIMKEFSEENQIKF